MNILTIMSKREIYFLFLLNIYKFHVIFKFLQIFKRKFHL